jgi:peptidyl-prolyl cis-trans isomerase SurA
MRKYALRAALAGLLFFTALGLAHGAQMVDRIVAVVNGEIITHIEVLERSRLIAGESSGQTSVDAVMPRVLESMIDDLIIRQEAARLKIEVSDSEVENEIRQFKARRRLSDDEFARSLRLQGMTPEQFKEQSRQDIVKNRMIGYMVRRKVVVTQEEIDAYLQAHQTELGVERSVDIQLIVSGDADSADFARKAVAEGEASFDEAVERYSVGPKANNGVLTGVRWRELDTPWREALRDMNVGDVSRPFLIQGKWVVLKLLDRKDGERQDRTVMEDEAREAILRPKLEERFKEYMAGLRTKAVIEKKF